MRSIVKWRRQRFQTSNRAVTVPRRMINRVGAADAHTSHHQVMSVVWGEAAISIAVR
jgi:hypothetical protein